jgi:uncharacterized surface protein with fasciclin (FAS1) repeats
MMKAAAFAIAIIVQLTAADPLRKRASQHQQRPDSIQKQQPPQLHRRRRVQGIKKRQLQTATTTAAASTACNFCPSGIVDPTLVLPVEDATTCLQAQEYAATLTSDDSICATVKLAEELCCPPTIYDLGVANTDFSTLVSLVDAAGLSDVLAGDGSYTLFGM